MGKNGHLRVYEKSKHALNRPLSPLPPENTVARGQLDIDAKNEEGFAKQHIPITQKVLTRGQERFNIYCSACHGFTGAGDGMVVKRGFLPPPSYHTERLRKAPDKHFFDVITHGSRAMWSYADRVDVEDRWAIVAYIRALQLSQNAKVRQW